MNILIFVCQFMDMFYLLLFFNLFQDLLNILV